MFKLIIIYSAFSILNPSNEPLSQEEIFNSSTLIQKSHAARGDTTKKCEWLGICEDEDD